MEDTAPSEHPVLLELSATPFAPHCSHLLDLLHALKDSQTLLILVGGFGLFLRRLWVEQSGAKTLYATVPVPRATEDFDIVVQIAALADREKTAAFGTALNRLGYEVIANRENYQFRKPGTATGSYREVKIDLMARDPTDQEPKLVVSRMRVKTKGKNNPIHAWRTPEAIAVEERLREVGVTGLRTSGESFVGSVWLPHTYSLFLMKLFAFRDEQVGKPGSAPREAYARKHATDLYTLAALLTEPELDEMAGFRERYASSPIVTEASHIVHELFGLMDSPGALRLREAIPALPLETLSDFLALLQEIFPQTPQE
jgi:hypothetical protein